MYGNVLRCSLRPSRHVKDQMIERGIAKEELLDAILKGPKQAQIGSKIIAAFKGLEVVYRQFPCNYFVITVYVKKSN